MNEIKSWSFGKNGYCFLTIRINENYYTYKAERGVIDEVIYLFDKHRENCKAKWKIFHAYKSIFSQKNLIHDTYIPPSEDERERIVSGLYEIINGLRGNKNSKKNQVNSQPFRV